MRFLNKLLCAVLAAALCFCAIGCDGAVSTAGSTNGFKLHMLDVGQGDSLLLECDGSYMLVDAGEADKGNRVAKLCGNYPPSFRPLWRYEKGASKHTHRQHCNDRGVQYHKSVGEPD